VHVKVSDDGCFILAVDSNKRVKVLRLDCALAPVFYSGRITTHVGTPVTYAQLSASDGRVARIGAKDCELHTFLNITPETTLILNSKTDFSIKDRDRCQRVMTETEAEADEWMEAILAVCAHLKKPYKDRCMLPKAAITKSYRFDLLQLINRRNGGRGLLPGKTIPKSAMEIIGYYTME
jgi:hypothetical protein